MQDLRFREGACAQDTGGNRVDVVAVRAETLKVLLARAARGGDVVDEAWLGAGRELGGILGRGGGGEEDGDGGGLEREHFEWLRIAAV